VLVVCVVGGVSFVEVGQVQGVLSSLTAEACGAFTRVVLVASHVINPEDCLRVVL
jgi:hypothetical protein